MKTDMNSLGGPSSVWLSEKCRGPTCWSKGYINSVFHRLLSFKGLKLNLLYNGRSVDGNLSLYSICNSTLELFEVVEGMLVNTMPARIWHGGDFCSSLPRKSFTIAFSSANPTTSTKNCSKQIFIFLGKISQQKWGIFKTHQYFQFEN